jgi:polyhydroxyalkanoate synthesis regulator phasin
MAEQSGDFLKDWQALARESWDAWLRQAQAQSASGTSFGAPAAASDDLFARSMAGAKSYLEWLQSGVTGAAGAVPSSDWVQQLQRMFAGAVPGGAGQPFAHPFAGFPPGNFDFPPRPAGIEPVAAFGHTREQQLQQQALAAAMLEYLDTSARYQALIQRANADGVARLQDRLARQAETGQPVESLKALYDQWVDAAEDAYADAALSDEFREVFGAMSNAQTRLRQLQQQQTEQCCRELGMPTRSEVASLGQRLQEVRRELRSRPAPADALAALRAEVAALKRRLDAVESKPAAAARTRAKAATPAKRKPAAAARTATTRKRK